MVKSIVPYCRMIVIISILSSAASSAAPEKELAKYLMSTYTALGIAGRPVRKVEDTVRVTVRMALQSIVSLEPNSLTASIWPALKWNDPFLSWNPANFNNQRVIAIPAKAIWKPDFFNWMDNKQNKAEQVAEMDLVNALVQDDGTVYWVPRVNIQTECRDPEQTGKLNCTYMFGSWVHNSKQVDFFFGDGNTDLDIKYFRPPQGIEVIEHSARKSYNTYACCPDSPYAVLTYSLVLRKWGACSNSEKCNCRGNNN